GPLAQLGITLLGWRMTHVGFGLLIAITSLPLVLWFLRDDPREMGLVPDGIPVAARNPDGSGRSASRGDGFSGPGLPRGYWLVFGANVFRGMTMYAILIHQVAYLVDAGFTRMAAASYFSVSSFIAAPAGFTAGAISDRLGRSRTYAGIAAMYVIAYLSLLLVRHPSAGVWLYAFVLSAGIAAGGSTSVFAAFLTDRLQGPRVGFLLGLQNIGFGLGATFGPFLAGAVFDLLGSYTAVFLLMAATGMGSAAVVSLSTRRPSVTRV
ncbi:MAG TPA: MFS transporter, partial [Candidatus Methylomirabilis sp.]|nr:MFS transporter [Candidatus Methylomirabilis sp.]